MRPGDSLGFYLLATAGLFLISGLAQPLSDTALSTGIAPFEERTPPQLQKRHFVGKSRPKEKEPSQEGLSRWGQRGVKYYKYLFPLFSWAAGKKSKAKRDLVRAGGRWEEYEMSPATKAKFGNKYPNFFTTGYFSENDLLYHFQVVGHDPKRRRILAEGIFSNRGSLVVNGYWVIPEKNEGTGTEKSNLDEANQQGGPKPAKESKYKYQADPNFFGSLRTLTEARLTSKDKKKKNILPEHRIMIYYPPISELPKSYSPDYIERAEETTRHDRENLLQFNGDPRREQTRPGAHRAPDGQVAAQEYHYMKDLPVSSLRDNPELSKVASLKAVLDWVYGDYTTEKNGIFLQEPVIDFIPSMVIGKFNYQTGKDGGLLVVFSEGAPKDPKPDLTWNSKNFIGF